MGASSPLFDYLTDIEQSCAVRVMPGNAVTLLENGPNTFPAMLRDIAAAEQSINFENFKIQSDATGWMFANALAERARAGVAVNVLYDAVGSPASDDYWAFLEGAGVNVRPFRPLTNGPKAVVRDHRKLIVIDGRVGYVGGHCIGDEWAGLAPDQPAWRDTHCRIEGPIVSALQESFCELWTETDGPACEQDDPRFFPELGEAGSLVVSLLVCGRQRGITRAYLEMIGEAREHIAITNAYFHPDQEILAALQEAARRGVRVQIITPGKSDIDVMVTAARSLYTELLEAGVEIYEYQPTVLHSKTAFVDGYWATIGSCNLDSRSLSTNYEANVGIRGQEFVALLQASFEEDLRNSVRIDLEEWRQRPLTQKLGETLVSWIGPQL